MSSFIDSLIAIAGIGFLILIHEWGHFMAARLCGVRAEIFSIGFGPALFRFRRGDTEYRLALVPLGGYVQMAGMEPGQGEGRPDELQMQSVGKRAFIYSAGVIMNTIFAFVVFPILFLIGVSFDVPVIGETGPAPGGPAWNAGLIPGDRILSIDGKDVPDFKQARIDIALGDPDGIDILIERNGEQETVRIIPDYDERNGFFMAQLGSPPIADPRPTLLIAKEGPAAEAGLHNGDLLLAIDGTPIDSLETLRDVLPSSWHQKAVRFEIERTEDGDTARREVEIAPVRSDSPPMVGIQPLSCFILGTRKLPHGPELTGVEAISSIAKGARLRSVNGQRVDDITDFHRALNAATTTDDGRVRQVLEIDGMPAVLVFEAAADHAQDLHHHLEWSLHLGPSLTGFEIDPIEDGPAQRAGVRAGDRVIHLGSVQDLEAYGKEKGLEGWDVIKEIISKVADGGSNDTIDMTVLHEDGTEADLQVALAPPMTFGLDYRTQTKTYLRKESNVFSAFGLGVKRSMNMFFEIYRTLRGMLTGSVSSRNLGGPIAIFQVSVALSEDLIKLMFFLAMLSINLAFINVLPIPVLDGGHLFFLMIEAVKGSKVNEKVQGYSQMIGVLLVLALVIYVTMNDLRRWLFE